MASSNTSGHSNKRAMINDPRVRQYRAMICRRPQLASSWRMCAYPNHDRLCGWRCPYTFPTLDPIWFLLALGSSCCRAIQGNKYWCRFVGLLSFFETQLRVDGVILRPFVIGCKQKYQYWKIFPQIVKKITSTIKRFCFPLIEQWWLG